MRYRPKEDICAGLEPHAGELNGALNVMIVRFAGIRLLARPRSAVRATSKVRNGAVAMAITPFLALFLLASQSLLCAGRGVAASASIEVASCGLASPGRFRLK